jgi:hypothetical protein
MARILGHTSYQRRKRTVRGNARERWDFFLGAPDRMQGSYIYSASNCTVRMAVFDPAPS